MQKLVFALWLSLCALTLPLMADEGHHHEAISPEEFGTVRFPVSCTAEAQKQFERGVALLHSFWYEEAEKTFEGVAKTDPRCAMAQWGIAMSKWHQLWNRPDEPTIKTAAAAIKHGRKLKPGTQREREYLEAIGVFYSNSKKMDHQARATAYAGAMEKLHARFPDDNEAAAFYGLALLASEPDEDATFANRKKAGAVLEPVFAAEPNHPGVAHYLIHAYDKPQLAQMGLPAAQRYAKIAPSAPHALHMPSHIFARVGDWPADIQSNLASIAATRKSEQMHMGGGGHQFHAMDFLVYAYLQSGQEEKARQVMQEVRDMPEMKDMYGMGYDPRTFALSAFPAVYAVELHHWKEAAALQPVAKASRGDQAFTYWARALGAARSGDPAQARKEIQQISAIRDELAKNKNRKQWADSIEETRKIASAWADFAEGHRDTAIASLHEIADKQDKLGEEPAGIPAREMLADMLLEAKRPAEALAEYQTDLRFNPNRFNGLFGAAQAAEQAGRASEATEYYAQLLKTCGGSDSQRPELAKAKSLMAQVQ